MAGTNYKVYWFTFINGWNFDGSPVIETHPSKGLNIRDAEQWLKREYPHAQMVGQATKEDIANYQILKSQTVRSSRAVYNESPDRKRNWQKGETQWLEKVVGRLN